TIKPAAGHLEVMRCQRRASPDPSRSNAFIRFVSCETKTTSPILIVAKTAPTLICRWMQFYFTLPPDRGKQDLDRGSVARGRVHRSRWQSAPLARMLREIVGRPYSLLTRRRKGNAKNSIPLCGFLCAFA